MSQEFNLPNVPYYNQLLNSPTTKFISCFPTSMAMCISYILQIIGKDKSAVGCGPNMTLEAYIEQCLNDPETKAFIRKEVSILGNWILSYAPRTVFVVEEFVANRLLSVVGYKAIFKSDLDYNGICDWIERTKLPAAISGNFGAVTNGKVTGHLNCITGFQKTVLKEFIANDPYSYALNGYRDASPTSTAGKQVRYNYGFYVIDRIGHMNAIVFEKI